MTTITDGGIEQTLTTEVAREEEPAIKDLAVITNHMPVPNSVAFPSDSAARQRALRATQLG